MERELKAGDTVVFLDAQAQPHQALVTKTWISVGMKPGCNVVYVSSDESKTDPYGRQLERNTSVVHKSVNAAGAWCWCWPDEL